MKILHVIPSVAPSYGGPAEMVLKLCHHLSLKGHEVSVYTTNLDGKRLLDVPLNKPIAMNGVEITYLPVQRRYFSFSHQFAIMLRENISNFDIVHISSIYNFQTLITSHFCRKYHIPYLINPHGSLDPFLVERHRYRKLIYTRLLLQRDLDNAAAIHYKTDDEMQLTAPLQIKAPGIVVPNGIDLKTYAVLPSLGQFKKNYPFLNNKKIILFLGRINFKKGLDILSQAFGEVARKRDDVYLVLAGPDNEGYSRKVKFWLQRDDAIDKTLFAGMLLGEDKLAVLRDSTIFVLPSYTENFGLAIVEAMAVGVPVIISNKVNIWREVEQVGSGLVTDCDILQVAQAILKLLDNPNLCKKMGQNGRKLVEEKYTWNKAADQMIKIYEEILNGKVDRSR